MSFLCTAALGNSSQKLTRSRSRKFSRDVLLHLSRQYQQSTSPTNKTNPRRPVKRARVSREPPGELFNWVSTNPNCFALLCYALWLSKETRATDLTNQSDAATKTNGDLDQAPVSRAKYPLHVFSSCPHWGFMCFSLLFSCVIVYFNCCSFGLTTLNRKPLWYQSKHSIKIGNQKVCSKHLWHACAGTHLNGGKRGEHVTSSRNSDRTNSSVPCKMNDILQPCQIKLLPVNLDVWNKIPIQLAPVYNEHIFPLWHFVISGLHCISVRKLLAQENNNGK